MQSQADSDAKRDIAHCCGERHFDDHVDERFTDVALITIVAELVGQDAMGAIAKKTCRSATRSLVGKAATSPEVVNTRFVEEYRASC